MVNVCIYCRVKFVLPMGVCAEDYSSAVIMGDTELMQCCSWHLGLGCFGFFSRLFFIWFHTAAYMHGTEHFTVHEKCRIHT